MDNRHLNSSFLINRIIFWFYPILVWGLYFIYNLMALEETLPIPIPQDLLNLLNISLSNDENTKKYISG